MTRDVFRYKFDQVRPPTPPLPPATPCSLFPNQPPPHPRLTLSEPMSSQCLEMLCHQLFPAPPLLQIPTGTIQVMDALKCWQGLNLLLLVDLQRENPGSRSRLGFRSRLFFFFFFFAHSCRCGFNHSHNPTSWCHGRPSRVQGWANLLTAGFW